MKTEHATTLSNSVSALHYHVTALEMTIYFNKEGDHDHNGLIYVLTENAGILKYIRDLMTLPEGKTPDPPSPEVEERARTIGVDLPCTKEDARKPHPLVRPLVLRARKGDHIEVQLQNEIRKRHVGIHLVADGYDVKTNDGSHVGANAASLAAPNGSRTYTWQCNNEGVFPFHDGGSYSGGEDGTNVHGLFGALIVEPPGSIWRDPVTGRTSKDQVLDGLYLDVIPSGTVPPGELGVPTTTLEHHVWGEPNPYANFAKDAHREFVIFFHDEPEFVPPHGDLEKNPCPDACAEEHAGGHGGDHGGHENLPIMPVSYRAEPMINRERILWERLRRCKETGQDCLDSPVLNEEQHHSSWMFGDPVTPILKAYIGDPVRIRFVHAGVKETHVFHLHLYEWHAVPHDTDSSSKQNHSPRIDAISVSPQTGHTIEPVWGAGNRQQVAADVIWHCHLYPHFHEGMWGMFRTFETLQTGTKGDLLESKGQVYNGRRIGCYPDGTLIEPLLPLPGRPLPPRPTATHPGYPLYIAGKVGQKSPRPPWPDRELEPGEDPSCGLTSLRASNMPADFDYRPEPTDLERNAFNDRPVPGELFTRNRFATQQARQWQEDMEFQWNGAMQVCHDVVVDKQRIEYNGHGWHDRDGHLFYLAADGDPDHRRDAHGDLGPKEPLFFRALHGQIVNLTLENRLPRTIERTDFDVRFPPCDESSPSDPRPNWEGECAAHVHMVKFDPVCGDGASVGWNYMSGPRVGMKMVYRWWADQEFGTIFFHDHLFANYRQKHGLYGALIVEPKGARFFDNFAEREIVSGQQARIKLRKPIEGKTWFREFCVGIGDFIPMWNGDGAPLNPPTCPGGHGDQGVMALNYRNDPIRERLRDPAAPTRFGDPADWFSSCVHGRDPYTTLFATFENDPVWIRLVQGSHEEQHSFQINGMRWRRFRANLDSSILNQQTLGIAEAFTFINHEPFGYGDYLYKLSGADDLWLGCWGIIRAFQRNTPTEETGGLLPLSDNGYADMGSAIPTNVEVQPAATVRHFHVVAEQRLLVYRAPDLIDPFGLIYRLTKVECSDGTAYTIDREAQPEPLVLRCCEGDVVRVTLTNNLPEGLRPEPFAPEVPLEERDIRTFRPDRPVSSRVSLHADLLQYAVHREDGSNVGRNPDQTIPPGGRRTYTWCASRPAGTNAGQPLGPLLLQDMADVRNHRHHGLVGALIVEAKGAIPFRVVGNEATARSGAPMVWHGARATVRQDGKSFEEVVLLLQDGLRLYLNGNQNFPLPDEPPGHGEDKTDHEDQGQKGFNYRAEPVGPSGDWSRDANGEWIPEPNAHRSWLAIPNPATPVWNVPVNTMVHFHLVAASDKPRNHSFTIHGVTWPEWRYLSEEGQPRVASESAISCGTTRTFEFTPTHTGDHVYRSGVLKWAVNQGLWGILRVVGTPEGARLSTSELTVSRWEKILADRRTKCIGLVALVGLAIRLSYRVVGSALKAYQRLKLLR